MNIGKKKSAEDGKRFLQDAFALEQKVLQVRLELANQTVTHPGTLGAVNENHFIRLLRQYLPKRYAVDTAIVIDSQGATSDQIDVVIYDNHFTPTLLDQENHRFVPAEAVYAVLEVKPTVDKAYLEYAGKKAASVRALARTSIPIPHAGGEYPPKPLFPIVAGIVAGQVEWADGFAAKAFAANLAALDKNSSLDCGLAASGSHFDVFAGELQCMASERALAYFLFRLLQKLQSLGTVPAIDWNAYAGALS